MLARVPWVKPLETKPRQRRLNPDRRRHLVETIAAVMRAGDPTPFVFEASCRHGIRGSLCLQGWSWSEADSLAEDIVATALRLVGARRPSWAEGQPEWAQNGAGALIERTRCVRCHGKLPEGHHKYCGDLCASASKSARVRVEDRAAYNARTYAWYAAWSAKQPDQPCEACGAMFRPKKPGRRFCSIKCRNHNNGMVSRAILKCEGVR